MTGDNRLKPTTIKRRELRKAEKNYRRHLAQNESQGISPFLFLVLGVLTLGTIALGSHSLEGLIDPVYRILAWFGADVDLDRAVLSLMLFFLAIRLFCLPSMLNHTRVDQESGDAVPWVREGNSGVHGRGFFIGFALAVPEGILLILGVTALSLLPCTRVLAYGDPITYAHDAPMSFPAVLWGLQVVLILLSPQLADHFVGSLVSQKEKWHVFLDQRKEGCARTAAAVLLEVFIYLPMFLYAAFLSRERPYASAAAIAALMIARVVGVLLRDILSVLLDVRNDKWVGELIQDLSENCGSPKRTSSIDRLTALGRTSTAVKAGLLRLRKETSVSQLQSGINAVLSQI